MTTQLLLFRHLQVPAKHLEWFRLANAGDYNDRKTWFYPFKSRFLYTHALPDGFDVQVIVRKCYCGDGIFRGIDRDRPRCFWEMCHRCNGSGIHDKKPWPGIMHICRPCVHHDGLDCRCSLQKRLGGPGMKVQSCEPMRGHMSFQDKNGRRTGKFFEWYAMPPRDCEGRQTTIEPLPKTAP